MARHPKAKQNQHMQQPDDAIAMLKEDHRRVRDLFQEYEATSDPRAKREIAEEACVELETHAQLEEHVFYPAVNEETDTGPELMKESLEEHQTMKHLIQQLRTMGPDHRAFDAKFKELIQCVEHHVEEEERQMFPLAEDEMENEMEDLRDEMQELKEQILAS